MSIRLLSYVDQISLPHCLAGTCWFKSNCILLRTQRRRNIELNISKGDVKHSITMEYDSTYKIKLALFDLMLLVMRVIGLYFLKNGSYRLH